MSVNEATEVYDPELENGDRERDSRYLWHPWSSNGAERDRLMIVSGSGIRVWDSAGREYLDASSLNATVGYGHPMIVEAAQRQMRTLHGVDLSAASHLAAGRLAEAIAHLLPPQLSRTLLLNSGSEGIEGALMIAASYWRHQGQRRIRVVTFARGYHGSTVLARSLSGLPPTSHPFNLPIDVTRVELPVSPAELKDPQMAPVLADAFRAAIDNGDEPPLAVIVEPMLNVGGGVLLPPGFLTRLRELCERADTLLILDEVFTGYGRTGRMFAFQHEDIAPDILVSSKGLSGGYGPISAVSAREDIYATFPRDELMGGLRYGHTTSGHAVSSAAALANIAVIERDGLVENARDRGAELLTRLLPVQDTPNVLDVRGQGLIVAIEMETMPDGAELVGKCQAQRVLVRQQYNAVLVVPPLTVTSDEIAAVAERILRAARSVRRHTTRTTQLADG